MVQMVKRGMTNHEPGTSYNTSQNISVIEWLRTSVTGIQTYQMVGNLYAILTQFTLTKKGFFYYNWYKKKKKNGAGAFYSANHASSVLRPVRSAVIEDDSVP